MSGADVVSRYALTRMESGHVDDVLAIERMSYTNPWTREAFQHEIDENGFSRPRVALSLPDDSCVAGYCVSWVVFDHLQIQNLAVHPGHRRRGLARMLLHRAFEDAVSSGATFAQLEVRESNVAAQKLYGSLGFQVNGTRGNYYSQPRENAVLLHKVFE